jgi:hypothetical protein
LGRAFFETFCSENRLEIFILMCDPAGHVRLIWKSAFQSLLGFSDACGLVSVHVGMVFDPCFWWMPPCGSSIYRHSCTLSYQSSCPMYGTNVNPSPSLDGDSTNQPCAILALYNVEYGFPESLSIHSHSSFTM